MALPKVYKLTPMHTRVFAGLHDSSVNPPVLLKAHGRLMCDRGHSCVCADSQEFMCLREHPRKFANTLVCPRTHRFREHSVTHILTIGSDSVPMCAV